MLPVNTHVRVTESGGRNYTGIVRGYDLSGTKYRISPETFWGSGEFTTTTTRWVFPKEVEELVWSIMDDAWVTREFWDSVNGE